MKLIAFGYKKGSGKSSCAKFLTTALKLDCRGVRIRRISFASKLKDICHQLFGWAGLQNEAYYELNLGYTKKEDPLPKIGMSPRDIWIAVGNRMRGVHKDVWLECALQESEHDFGIISDLRFINEAAEVKRRGGILVKVVRNGLEQGTDDAEVALNGYTGWDLVIDNNGSLNDLNTQIVTLAENLCVATHLDELLKR